MFPNEIEPWHIKDGYDKIISIKAINKNTVALVTQLSIGKNCFKYQF